MAVHIDPDLLGDEDVQAVLTAIDDRLSNMADVIKGEALNPHGVLQVRELMEKIVAPTRHDWRSVVGEAAVIAGCLKVIVDLDWPHLRHTLIATKFPVETALLILEAAVEAGGGTLEKG